MSEITKIEVCRNRFCGKRVMMLKETAECPSTEEWIQTMYFSTMEYYSAISKDHIETFIGKWMQFETIFISEIHQTHMYKYHIVSLVQERLRVHKIQNPQQIL